MVSGRGKEKQTFDTLKTWSYPMARKNQNQTLMNAAEIDIASGASPNHKENKKMAQFTLFAAGGRGKKSTNAPCTVNYEEISFDALSQEQKQSLVDRLVKDTARKEYYDRSKGFRMLNEFLNLSRDMMTKMGLEPTEEQVKAAATLLASREKVTLAFEPVVEINLTAEQVLNAKDEDEDESPNESGDNEAK
jgi:hypothetical protein